jgi:hypothetical protein
MNWSSSTWWTWPPVPSSGACRMTKRWSREARTLGTALRSTPAWTARGGSRRPPSAPGRPSRRRRGCPPDQPVVAGQQLLQLPRPDAAGCRHRTPSERPSRRPPPGSSAPCAGLAPMPTVPAQQPGRAPKGCGGTGRERPASRGMTKQSKRARPQTWPFGARGGIRTSTFRLRGDSNPQRQGRLGKAAQLRQGTWQARASLRKAEHRPRHRPWQPTSRYDPDR